MIISFALQQAMRVQILVNIFANVEFAAEIFMKIIQGIIGNPLVPREYNENSPCVRILVKKEVKQHIFP